MAAKILISFRKKVAWIKFEKKYTFPNELFNIISHNVGEYKYIYIA